MLFDLNELTRIFKLPTLSVLHVGAHEGEESKSYEALGWRPVTWIEAQSELVVKLRTQLNSEFNTIIEAAVWDQGGVKLRFNISSNSQSSSLLNFGTHSDDYPTIKFVKSVEVITKRLDEVLSDDSDFQFINLDLQGAEGRALIGLGTLLSKCNYVYTEVNKREVYVGCSLVNDLDDFLAINGFSRVATRWVPFKGWGDAFYVRDGKNNPGGRLRFALARTQASYYLTTFVKATFAAMYSRLKK